MPIRSFTLFDIRGRVQAWRKGLDPALVDGWINDRLRVVLDQRTWASLIKQSVLSVPDQYAVGTVALAFGSPIVTGTATAWPVNDAVNATIAAQISQLGYQRVVPSSMAGITTDTILYVDAAGAPETVPVVQTDSTGFFANFNQFHNAGSTIWESSLVNRQFRLGTGFPIWTILSVQDSTHLTLDSPFGIDAVTGLTYQIVKMYVTLALDVRDVRTMVDQMTGWPVRLKVSKDELDWRDPQRTMVGDNSGVINLAEVGINANGNMVYELWPTCTAARQWQYTYLQDWPTLKRDTDILPPFLNPTIFYYGAMANALAFRVSADDPYFNPQSAMAFEGMYERALEAAKNDDERRICKDYTFEYESIMGAMGANFWRSHDSSLMNWDM